MADDVWLAAKEGGVIFVGDKGVMAGSRSRMPNVLGELGKDLRPPDRKIAKSPATTSSGSPPPRAARPPAPISTTPAHSPNSFSWATSPSATGKPLDWDPVHITFPNAPEANAQLRREYRKGWSLEPYDA